MSDVVREDPPPHANPARKPSAAYRHMLQLATTPGEWGRIGSYGNRKVAAQRCYDLRGGRRKHPPGTWEFRHGAIPEEPNRFGLWARLVPQTGGTEDESPPDVG
jgi:hypothetical protein